MHLRFLLLGAFLALTACSGPDGPLADHIRRDLGQLSPAEERILGGPALDSGAPPHGSGERSHPEPLADSTTLNDYIQLALARNPRIAAAQQRILRLRERIPQESSLPDPMLEAQPIGQMAETAAGEMMWMVGIRQEFMFPGKLSAMGAVAAQEAKMAERDLEMVQREIAAETARAYWSLYAAERALDITGQNRALMAQFQGAAEARYRAGEGQQADLLRANTDLVMLDNELLMLEQNRTTATGALNALIDRPVTAPVPPVAPLSRTVDFAVGDLDALLARAAATNPAIAAVREQVELARRQRIVAGQQRLPDFFGGISYAEVDDMGISMNANGQDQWWITVGATIPIWVDRYSAAEREATRAMLEALANLAVAQNKNAAQVQQAVAMIQTQQRTTAVLREAIIPQARQTLDSSLAAYRAGTVDFMTVADNARRVLELQLMEHNAIADLGRALAELEELVGAPLTTNTPAAQEATR
jgi:outer membrane protein, heavy metal efflux system